ncbi:hypothetical protein D9M68_325330 [compost metagenome]
MVAHVPGHLVAQGVQIGATVVVDHALGVAGGAGGVIQGDGLPLVLRPLPGIVRVAFGQQRLVVEVAHRLAFAVFRVIDVDHQRRVVEHADGGMDHIEELAIGDQRLGFAVLKHEGNGLGIQAHVQGVEYSADHRHAEVRLEHLRDVRQHHRHRVALADTTAGQGRGQAPAARIGLCPVAADGTVDHGRVVGINSGGALDEAQGREGDVVDGGRGKALIVDRHI